MSSKQPSACSGVHNTQVPGGRKIVLLGPSCPSRVLRGGETAGYGHGAVIGGRVREGGVPPPAQSAEGRA